MGQLRVLLAEDHAVVREGTRSILQQDPGILVVGEAADGAEAVELARDMQPDVVLLDMALPVFNGVEATRHLRALPDPPKVVILSAYDDADYVHAALEAGATGYLLKTARAAEVVAAIRAVMQGEVVLHARIARVLVARREGGRAGLLSPRELEVLRHAANGVRNKDIAASMGVSARTVEGHLTAVFNKLGVSSRTEAIVEAMARGFLELPTSPLDDR